jgi:hypothetical protein
LLDYDAYKRNREEAQRKAFIVPYLAPLIDGTTIQSTLAMNMLVMAPPEICINVSNVSDADCSPLPHAIKKADIVAAPIVTRRALIEGLIPDTHQRMARVRDCQRCRELLTRT